MSARWPTNDPCWTFPLAKTVLLAVPAMMRSILEAMPHDHYGLAGGHLRDRINKAQHLRPDALSLLLSCKRHQCSALGSSQMLVQPSGIALMYSVGPVALSGCLDARLSVVLQAWNSGVTNVGRGENHPHS
jgi:hypothetical protein